MCPAVLPYGEREGIPCLCFPGYLILIFAQPHFIYQFQWASVACRCAAASLEAFPLRRGKSREQTVLKEHIMLMFFSYICSQGGNNHI